jgi:hypothetical protein
LSKPTINANSPYAMFETDDGVEQAGVLIEYGPFYFRVARAGGSNTRYRDQLRDRLRPHRRALATETMNEDLANRIIRDVFAETVVLGWGSEEHGEGKIAGRDGKPIDFSVEAVKALFKDLPELAGDVMDQATKFNNFRAVIAEIDAKNS